MLTDDFLNLSAVSDVDLRKQGIGPGERWCIEATRWKEVVNQGKEEVPSVKDSESRSQAPQMLSGRIGEHAAQPNVGKAPDSELGSVQVSLLC